MPIRPPFKWVPRDVVQWATFFRDAVVEPSDDTVGEDQLIDGEVTYEKIQDVTPDRLLGRDSSPAGTVQELTASDGIEFTGSGIRRSALTGDVTAAAGSNETTFREATACSVVGRSANTAGAMADIAAASDNQFLVRRSNVLGFGGIVDADIPSTIARDTEITSAISAHEAAGDPHPGYTTAAELSAAISALNLTSGTYTPTLTNVANVDSSSANLCQYFRIGNIVHVGGSLAVNATAAAATRVAISLPIASSFSDNIQCAGVAATQDLQHSGIIRSDAAGDYAELVFAATDVDNHGYYFNFSYQVL